MGFMIQRYTRDLGNLQGKLECFERTWLFMWAQNITVENLGMNPSMLII